MLGRAELLVTGVGCKNVARTLKPYLELLQPGLLIHVGFSGGLSPGLKLGDLVAVQEIWQEGGGERFRMKDELVKKALALPLPGVRMISGMAVCRDEMLIQSSAKRGLALRLGIQGEACVDLESAAVVRICQEREIPLLTIRSISDCLEEDLPLDFNQCRSRGGNLSLPKILWQVMKQPQRWSGLFRLYRSTGLCAQQLGRFATNWLETTPLARIH
jgi:adenosylhomocysteine nucleosidase